MIINSIITAITKAKVANGKVQFATVKASPFRYSNGSRFRRRDQKINLF
ncbi:hypothetical protein ACFO5T_05795 [Dokdonia genika]|uniref:Uncharacterized protein n=1 Tax=Dokdonia genika TaxID=308113 RepID=A0ABV9L7W7_9FLAO